MEVNFFKRTNWHAVSLQINFNNLWLQKSKFGDNFSFTHLKHDKRSSCPEKKNVFHIFKNVYKAENIIILILNDS